MQKKRSLVCSLQNQSGLLYFLVMVQLECNIFYVKMTLVCPLISLLSLVSCLYIYIYKENVFTLVSQSQFLLHKCYHKCYLEMGYPID